MYKTILAFLLLVSPMIVCGASFYHTGDIYKIGSITSRADGDFIFVDGFNDAGTCPKTSVIIDKVAHYFVIARFPSTELGDRSYSLALAAKMSGKQINVGVNDLVKNSSGDCFISTVSIEGSK